MNVYYPKWLLYWMLYSFGLGLLAEIIFGKFYTRNTWLFLGILTFAMILSLLRCRFLKEEKEDENVQKPIDNN